jgi:hypothetical protein
MPTDSISDFDETNIVIDHNRQQNNTNHKDGIDIRQALEILSHRPSCYHDTVGQDHPHRIPSEVKRWGQRIDLYHTPDECNHHHRHDEQVIHDTTTTDPNDDTSSTGHDHPKQPQQPREEEGSTAAAAAAETFVASSSSSASDLPPKERIQQERKERQEKIQATIQQLSLTQLIRTVQQCQQQRVITYRTYNRFV